MSFLKFYLDRDSKAANSSIRTFSGDGVRFPEELLEGEKMTLKTDNFFMDIELLKLVVGSCHLWTLEVSLELLCKTHKCVMIISNIG